MSKKQMSINMIVNIKCYLKYEYMLKKRKVHE
jgi:hypothetical protein